MFAHNFRDVLACLNCRDHIGHTDPTVGFVGLCLGGSALASPFSACSRGRLTGVGTAFDAHSICLAPTRFTYFSLLWPEASSAFLA